MVTASLLYTNLLMKGLIEILCFQIAGEACIGVCVCVCVCVCVYTETHTHILFMVFIFNSEKPTFDQKSNFYGNIFVFMGI